MATSVIFLVLCSALLHASWNAIVKGGTDKLVEVAMNAAGGGLVAVLVLPFLPLPSANAVPFLAASSCLHFGYYATVALAYRGTDMSYAYSLMRGTAPLITAISLHFFLSVALPAGGFAGVALLSGGILLLALDSLRCGRFSKAGTASALCNACIIAGYTMVDGFGARAAEHAVSYTCWLFFINAFPISFFTLVTRKKEAVTYVFRRWKTGMIGGVCGILAYGTSLWAMTRAPIHVVAALRETSVIFGMLLAVFFLNEKLTPARVIAVLLVAGGGIVLRMSA